MQFIIEIVKDLIVAWRGGKTPIRAAIVSIIILPILGMIVLTFSAIFIVPGSKAENTLTWIAAVLAGIAGCIGILVSAYQKSNEQTIHEQRIQEVEQRVKDNPSETQAAWELARVKLESYLNRNLKQVRSIFWLTLFVMMIGFGLIVYGVYEAYGDPARIKASLISSVSGVIVSFIGATFLVLYKATMAQATEYVNILERINAVGMSVNILGSLDDEDTRLKQQALADVAKQLLELYMKKSKT
jgi:hypothetical protein